tara:strand:- start:168 stop:425 length:258 start_codon:yes stop_codon:yes gene_type:complete
MSLSSSILRNNALWQIIQTISSEINPSKLQYRVKTEPTLNSYSEDEIGNIPLNTIKDKKITDDLIQSSPIDKSYKKGYMSHWCDN